MPGRRSPPTAESDWKRREQGVDQRAGIDAGAGVHHHARGFVDGHEILVFVEHTQWNRFRLGAQRTQLGGLHIDAVALAQHAG